MKITLEPEVPMYLTDLLFLGDLAETLLVDARKSAGLNLTELKICAQLAKRPQRAMSPQQLSSSLCLAPTRIVNQLQTLLAAGLVVRDLTPHSAGAMVDNRQRFYLITKDGRSAVDGFLSSAQVVNGLLLTLTSRKVEDEVGRLSMQLRKLAIQGVMDSPEKFFSALNDGRVPPVKRGGALHQALWYFQQKRLNDARTKR